MDVSSAPDPARLGLEYRRQRSIRLLLDDAREESRLILRGGVGGIGIAPGANINYQSGIALFEATHGTAPDIAGKDIVNPLSIILSGVMMLEYLGWNESAVMIRNAIRKVIKEGSVTKDLYTLLVKERGNGKLLSTSEFTKKLIASL